MISNIQHHAVFYSNQPFYSNQSGVTRRCIFSGWRVQPSAAMLVPGWTRAKCTAGYIITGTDIGSSVYSGMLVSLSWLVSGCVWVWVSVRGCECVWVGMAASATIPWRDAAENCSNHMTAWVPRVVLPFMMRPGRMADWVERSVTAVVVMGINPQLNQTKDLIPDATVVG